MPILIERQSLFGSSSDNSTAPATSSSIPSQSLSGNNNGGESTNMIWKYVAIVIVLVVLATIALSRLLLVRRLRSKKLLSQLHSNSSTPMSSTSFSRQSQSQSQSLPPYYDREEYHRRRQQNREVRQALRDAGLLLVEDEVIPSPSEVERANAERLARRERRERRRQRRREEEEGAGLPAYSKEKGEGEEVLERGGGLKDSEEGSEDESSDSEDEGTGVRYGVREVTTMTPLISTPQLPERAATRERRRE